MQAHNQRQSDQHALDPAERQSPPPTHTQRLGVTMIQHVPCLLVLAPYGPATGTYLHTRATRALYNSSTKLMKRRALSLLAKLMAGTPAHTSVIV